MIASAGETLIGLAAVIAAIGTALTSVIGALNRRTVKGLEHKLDTGNGMTVGQVVAGTHAVMNEEVKPAIAHVKQVIDERTLAFAGMPETFASIAKMTETFVPAFMEHLAHHPKEES